MSIFPAELWYLIFRHIDQITYIRTLASLCKLYKPFCDARILQLQTAYSDKYGRFTFKECLNTHSVQKFTVELVLDLLPDLIPDSYYIAKNDMLCSMLAFIGRSDLMDKALDHGCIIAPYALSCAAYNGRVDIIKYIQSKGLLIDTQVICYNAFINGHINILKWCLDNEYPIRKSYFDSAFNYQQYDLLQYALDNGRPVGYRDWEISTTYHNPKILQWAKDHKFTIDSIHISSASATRGNVDTLQWLSDNYYKLDNRLELDAASHNHVNVLQWLRDNFYNMDIGLIIKHGFLEGHNEVFQWLKDQDNTISFSAVDINYSINHRHINMLQWLIDHNYCNKESFSKINPENTNLPVIHFMSKNNFITKPISLESCLYNYELIIDLVHNDLLILDFNNYKFLNLKNLDVIKCMHTKIYSIPTPSCHIIISNNNIHMNKYTDNIDTNQKLIYCKNDGSLDITELNCHNNCFWHFITYYINNNHHQEIANWSYDHIKNCEKHRPYTCYLCRID